MRKSYIIPALFAVTCALSACGGGNKTSEERSPGETAFRTSCQTCHTLPRPTMKSAGEWPALVARYGERGGLTAEKIEVITQYLMTATDR